MSNVLIINGSPRTEKGNTAFVLKPFVEGMEQAGASIDLVYSKKMNVLPCQGCLDCWNRQPVGECVLKDDMQAIYDKLSETDILIVASPVYIPLPGELQNVINRLCAKIEPILEFKDGRTRVRFHENIKISRIVSIAIGGWWELENLDTLVRVVKEFASLVRVDFPGAIRRPHAYCLRRETEKTKKIMNRIKKVGYELVNTGKIDSKDLEFIYQPLLPREEYIERHTNNYLQVKNKKE